MKNHKTRIFILLTLLLIIQTTLSKRQRKRTRRRKRQSEQKSEKKEKAAPVQLPESKDQKAEQPPKPQKEKSEKSIDEQNEADEGPDGEETSNWSKPFNKLMNSKIFLTSKEYYDSIHQCGVDYFERSIEYLSVKSSEYYSLIKQNEAMRNGFIVLIYSFLFMKIFSVLCSCCRRPQKGAGNSSRYFNELKRENAELKKSVESLRAEIGKSPSAQVDMKKLKESIKNELKNLPGNQGGSTRAKEDEEIFTFFHDSLRDLWSEIKSIKSRLRETDVSQLSFNFDSKMFKSDNTKKNISQVKEEKTMPAKPPGMPKMVTPEVKPQLGNITEKVEDSTKPAPSPAKKAPIPVIKRPPITKPKIPIKTIPRKKPMPLPKPVKTPSPIPEEKKQETPLPVEEAHVEPVEEIKTPVKEEQAKPPVNPVPPVNPFSQPPVSETLDQPVNQEPVESFTPVKTEEVQEPKAPVTVPNTEVQNVEAPKPMVAPQRPILKGPKIPTRKIPTRKPVNRRIPRKPIKLPQKPNAPKPSQDYQAKLGI